MYRSFFDLSTKKQTFGFIFVHSAQLDRVCAPENSKRERAPIQKRVPLFYCIVNQPKAVPACGESGMAKP